MTDRSSLFLTFGRIAAAAAAAAADASADTANAANGSNSANAVAVETKRRDKTRRQSQNNKTY